MAFIPSTEYEREDVELLRIENAGKRYGDNWAVRGLDLDFRIGEVHAICGENGAGKSTLCKMISGAVDRTEGSFYYRDKKIDTQTPRAAIDLGIFMVYQEGSLAPHLTVAQNIVLGREPLLSSKKMRNKQAKRALDRFNFPVPVDTKLAYLPPSAQQMVEIARAYDAKADLIILDEPTAKLSEMEANHLFDVLEDLTDEGKTFIYISHFLDDVLRISDRVTVLRQGECVETRDADDWSKSQIVKAMVGKDYKIQELRPSAKVTKKEKVLEIKDVRKRPMVNGCSLSIYSGEVTGLAGLIGSGRSELMKILAGHLKRDWYLGGSIEHFGKSVRFASPRAALKQGIVYITEDRKLEGFFQNVSPPENVYSGCIQMSLLENALYSQNDQKKVWESWKEKLNISALDENGDCDKLSGGNQQKVVIAKALSQNPKVVIFDEPSIGVDIEAIRDIYKSIKELAEQGCAVVVISSYLPELLQLSHRILVMRQGRISGELSSDEATEKKILELAF